MNSYLQLIEVVVTVVIALSIFAVVFTCGEITSEVIAGGVYLLVLLISVFFADKIVTYISADSRFTGRLVWYGGFAYLDILAVFLVSRIHMISEVTPSKVSGMVVFALWSLGFVQIGRLVDRYSFDVMGDFYRFFIPVVNIAVMAVVVVTAIRQILLSRRLNGSR